MATVTESPRHLLCSFIIRFHHFIIRYTHLSPTAFQSESFRLRLKRAPHTSQLSQYFHFSSQISIQWVHHVFQLVLGWLLNWETFSLLTQLHSCYFLNRNHRWTLQCGLWQHASPSAVGLGNLLFKQNGYAETNPVILKSFKNIKKICSNRITEDFESDMEETHNALEIVYKYQTYKVPTKTKGNLPWIFFLS